MQILAPAAGTDSLVLRQGARGKVETGLDTTRTTDTQAASASDNLNDIQAGTKPAQSRRMLFSFVNGARVQFTLHELLGYYRHRSMVTFMSLLWLAMVFLKPFPALGRLPLANQVVFWGMVLPGAFAVFLVTLALLGRWRTVGRSWIAHFTAGLTCGIVSPPLGIWLGLEPSEDIFKLQLIIVAFSMVCSMVAEFMTITYMMPGYVARLARPVRKAAPTPRPETPEAVAEPALPAQVVLLGKTFTLTDLRLVSAEEHYVRIQTVDGRQLLRGRISDIEAQLPDALGLRVHRSHWVAASAVQALNRSRDGWLLELTDGTTVPVARPRREAVRDWLEAMGKA